MLGLVQAGTKWLIGVFYLSTSTQAQMSMIQSLPARSPITLSKHLQI